MKNNLKTEKSEGRFGWIITISFALSLAFVGYLSFSYYMDWPWDGRYIKNVQGEDALSTFTVSPDTITRGELETYYLNRAQDICAKHGGEWGHRTIELDYCKVGEKIYEYTDHSLIYKIPEKIRELK